MAVIRINEIIDRLLTYHPQADSGLVQKAYVWSAKLHAGTLRMSGQPYLSHPLEVAGILTQLELHESSISAGLLHDVLEDSTLTLEELEAEFGNEIARLVDGVTKIGKIQTEDSRIEVQAENFRKIILAMARDVRVILIKLADRLHNMMSLEFLPEHKRIRIARETLEIYAPIAGRLGIHWIQAQLEDLSFQHLKPEIFFRLSAQLARNKEARQEYIAKVQVHLQQVLKQAGIESRVSGRFKHLYSIYRKMEKQNLAFEEVHDLVAFRIVVDNITECYDALRVIHSSMAPIPGRIKDYIALPKSNMYRSLHTTVIGPEGERVEIQIRTREMHALAEYGIAAHWRYKETGAVPSTPPTDKKTQEFLDHLVELHEELKDPYHFLESVKSEVVPDVIVVFTPHGDIIELPIGSCPIDFAYAIHTDLGEHCAGARVDGKIVPLNHVLKSGETVEVITSKSVGPCKAWLGFVKLPRARARISHFLSSKETSYAREQGRQWLESELMKNRRGLGTLIEDGTMDRIAKHFNLPSVNRLLEAVGQGRIPVRKVVLQVVPAEELRGKHEPKSRKKKRPTSAKPRTAKKTKAAPPDESSDSFDGAEVESKPVVAIKSYQDPLLTFASCCLPLAGEAVTAIQGENLALEIHRADCPKVLEASPAHTFPARWESQVEGEGISAIEVVAEDKKGLLAKLSAIISDANLNIVRALVRTTEERKAIHGFRISIKQYSQLARVIKAIEQIDGVISVRRG